MITLGNAAKQLGISKPTLSKAISKGQLSAAKREDGSFAIDPSELMRWWEGVRHRFHPQPVSDLQAATLSDSNGNSSNGATGNPVSGNGSDIEVRVQMARLEAELAGIKDLLRVHREQIDDLRGERDKLLSQVDSAHRLLTHRGGEKRSWWRRLAG